jgi:hypothetical protein
MGCMSLYVPGQAGGFVHQGAIDIDRKLREGDGITWTGDPRLELRIGTLETPKVNGKRRVARRYEVWRNMEDGREERIGHWTMAELGMILHDVAVMKAGGEGRIDNVSSRIDLANAKVEKDQSDKYRDAMGEMLDHAARLNHDLTEGRKSHYGVGRGLAE